MECYIKTPNLPQKRVNTVIIGEKYKETKTELESFGIEVLSVKENIKLDEETSCHADMLFLHTGDNKVFIDESQTDLINILSKKGFILTEQKGISSPYPNDTLLNKAVLNRYIFGLTNNNQLNRLKYESITVKQGYTKCSICVVDENSIITDDTEIATLLKNYQFDVLLISKGDIYLSEKHYGFIGGTCGKLNKDTIYFNGNLKMHKDYTRIIDFLNNRNIKPVFNESRILTDIGGIIPIIEEF